MNIAHCTKCNESVLAERFCSNCGAQLSPLPVQPEGPAGVSTRIQLDQASSLVPSSKSLSEDSSPVGKDLDRIENWLLVVNGLTERIVQSIKGEPKAPDGSNGKKRSKNKRRKKRKGELAVKMFTIGSISVILISTIILTVLWGLSAKTAVPLSALIIIFVLAVLPVMRGQH